MSLLHSYGHGPAAPAEAVAGPGLGGRRAPLPQWPDHSVQAEQGPRGCYMWSPTAHLRWCGGVTLPCLWGNLRFQVTLGFGKVRRHFLSGSIDSWLRGEPSSGCSRPAPVPSRTLPARVTTLASAGASQASWPRGL